MEVEVDFGDCSGDLNDLKNVTGRCSNSDEMSMFRDRTRLN